MFGYGFVLSTHPGQALLEPAREELFARLQRSITLTSSFKLEYFPPQSVDDSPVTQLYKMWVTGEIGQTEYEQICADAGIVPYEPGVKEAQERELAVIREHGQALAHGRLPGTEAKAKSIYADLVRFALREDLVLHGDEANIIDLEAPGELPPRWHEKMAPPRALPGFFISFQPPFETRHWLGGEHDITGAQCPNCDLPLVLYLALDAQDKRLGLANLPLARIPLLWCMRCCIAEDDFVYRIIGDEQIEILQYEVGIAQWREDWDTEIGGEALPRRPFRLLPIPPRVQELFDVAGRWYPLPEDKITEEETCELENLLKATGDPSLSRGRHHVLNQVGGRPALPQGLWLPDCPYCDGGGTKNKMLCIANLTDDDAADYKIRAIAP